MVEWMGRHQQTAQCVLVAVVAFHLAPVYVRLPPVSVVQMGDAPSLWKLRPQNLELVPRNEVYKWVMRNKQGFAERCPRAGPSQKARVMLDQPHVWDIQYRPYVKYPFKFRSAR